MNNIKSNVMIILIGLFTILTIESLIKVTPNVSACPAPPSTCFSTIPVQFNFLEIVSAFVNKLFNGIQFILSVPFTLSTSFCLMAFSCQFIITIPPPTTVYTLYNSTFNFFITVFVVPVAVILGAIVAMKKGANIDENMVLPIALFTVLMISWAGQGLIFPTWVSLLVVLICGVGLSYSIGNYFLGNRRTSEE